MENYFLMSTLLIPAPQFAGKTFRWIDTFTGKRNKNDVERVNIIAFNTEKKEEIKPLLEGELRRLQQLEKAEELDEHNQMFIEKTIWEIEDGAYEHKVPAELLSTLNAVSGLHLTDNEVIYLSGISSISRSKMP